MYFGLYLIYLYVSPNYNNEPSAVVIRIYSSSQLTDFILTNSGKIYFSTVSEESLFNINSPQPNSNIAVPPNVTQIVLSSVTKYD